MSDKRHPFQIAFVLMLFCLLFALSIFHLYEYINIESLQNQINSDFPVVYINTSHMVSIGGVISMPILTVSLATHFIFKSSMIPIKWVGCAVALALIIMIPGQFGEFSRLYKLAESNGYSGCPPFTIASSGRTVKAMVKETRYCSDREINRLGQGGHYHELVRIDKYLQSKEESHPLSSAR